MCRGCVVKHFHDTFFICTLRHIIFLRQRESCAVNTSRQILLKLMDLAPKYPSSPSVIKSVTRTWKQSNFVALVEIIRTDRLILQSTYAVKNVKLTRRNNASFSSVWCVSNRQTFPKFSVLTVAFSAHFHLVMRILVHLLYKQWKDVAFFDK
jgi:hypothetical protein